MKIIHLSAECYPAAKVGGLADVVGSLPKYLSRLDTDTSVIMPKYRTEWLQNKAYETVYEKEIQMGESWVSYAIRKEKNQTLGFPLYVVDIPEFFDRPGIYGDPGSAWGYADEAERFIAFQTAALAWISSFAEKPDVIHCHDHHAGLVPFMMKECYAFNELADIPTVLTVHNAEYQGIFGHDKDALLPDFDARATGLLDWDGLLNSLAAGLKCCWQITTVSPTYMKELQHSNNRLKMLFAHEAQKSRGILNGIDKEVWDPQTDEYLNHHYAINSLQKGKRINKSELCEQFNLSNGRPLISFIGRLVGEKGADLLPDLFERILAETTAVNFLVLGTGSPKLHKKFRQMSDEYLGFFDASLNYNEKLAHQIYAGSDFMIIPSRVEPCGLNQMYAMQYGTVPIVRAIGGLKDTVRDINQPDGHGITFNDFSLKDGTTAVNRALELYNDKDKFKAARKKNMTLDYSWNTSAKTYIEMYSQLIT